MKRHFTPPARAGDMRLDTGEIWNGAAWVPAPPEGRDFCRPLFIAPPPPDHDPDNDDD